MRLTVSALLAVLSLAVPLRSEKRALLIGINDYPHARKLKGAVNDVVAFRALLLGPLGFAEANVDLLLNEQATRPGILLALRSLAERSRPGDSLLMYYSGHGWLVDDLDRDESVFDPEAKYDQALVPYDAVPWPRDRAMEPNPTLISDDEIASALGSLVGRRLLVIFDSCHAGNGLRDVAAETRALYDIALPPPRFKSIGPPRPELDLTGPVLFVSAAAWRESASDLGDFEGRRHGALTAGLLRTIAKLGPGWQNATWDELFRKVRQDLRENGFTAQTPAIAGAASLRRATVAGFFDPMPAQEIADLLPVTSFQVSLEVSRSQFVEGELLEVAAESERDGYLYLFDIDSEQQVTQLFPNQFEPDNRVQALKLRRIPEKKDRYQFRAGKPYGQSAIVAVVTREPWTEHTRLNLPANFQPIAEFQKTRLRDGLRGLVDRPEWASQRVWVEVVSKQAAATPPPAPPPAPPPQRQAQAPAPPPAQAADDDDSNLTREDQEELPVRRPALFKKLAALAERFSPVFWQDVGSGVAEFSFRPWKDFFIRYDFDRTTLGPNWPEPQGFQDETKRVRNRSLDAWLVPDKRRNITPVASMPGVFQVTDERSGESVQLDLRPTVYWAALTTDTHYFFHYAGFKAEDWKPLFGHPGDLEGTTIIVDRKTEKMVAALALAHDDVQTTPSRGFGEEPEANIEVLVDPALESRGLWDENERPVNGALAVEASRDGESAPKEHQDIYSESKGHGQYGPHKIHSSRYIVYASFFPDQTYRAPSFDKEDYPVTAKLSEVKARHKYRLVYIGTGTRKVTDPEQKTLWSEYRALPRFPGGANPPWCWRDNLFFRTGWWRDPRVILKIGDGHYRLNPYLE